ncbi:MAG: chemoreceptor glutamine deamidase CheD [Burkholderiaceae bacterium]
MSEAKTTRPRSRGVAGEAGTLYFDRDFGCHAVKVLPGEFFVDGPDVVLTTVLGSCVSACLWDARAKVGGMNHFMLPEGAKDGDPIGLAGRYGVHAMELLINELLKCGARRAALEAQVFGGGNVMTSFTLNVGERNVSFVRKFLVTEGIRIVAEDLLDTHPRRVAFFPATGRALVRKLARADASLVAAEQNYRARIDTVRSGGDIELF